MSTGLKEQKYEFVLFIFTRHWSICFTLQGSGIYCGPTEIRSFSISISKLLEFSLNGTEIQGKSDKSLKHESRCIHTVRFFSDCDCVFKMGYMAINGMVSFRVLYTVRFFPDYDCVFETVMWESIKVFTL